LTKRRCVSVAYSSSANLGSGFDVLALAHSAFRDEVEVQISKKFEVEMNSEQVKPESNTAGLAILELSKMLGIEPSFKVSIRKGIPYGLGFGSSGASAVAALKSANELLGNPLSEQDLIDVASIGEVASAGSPHPDNVSASMLGGFVAVVNRKPVRAIRIPTSLKPKFLIIYPIAKLEGKTKKARELLPEKVAFRDYIANTTYITSLLTGLLLNDIDLLGNGMNDEIVEVARRSLFPHYKKIKEVALTEGAKGVCVSGAGPAILIMFKDKVKDKVKERSLTICEDYYGKCDYREAEIAKGAEVVECEV